MPEVLANSLDDPTTTLAAGITSGATSLTVASGHGARFPSAGTFRVVVGSELITVGARSGDTLSSLGRGAEGTAAASHTTGDAVDLVVTAGALTTAFARRDGAPLNALDYGTAGTGTAIQAAIDAASAAGGGGVIVGGGGVWDLAATLTLKTDVVVRVLAGTTLRWTGSAGGTMFATDGTAPVRRSGLVGEMATLDCNSLADCCMLLNSVQYGEWGGFEVINGRVTTRVLRLLAHAASMTGGYESGRNAVFNDVHDLIVSGACETVLELFGANAWGVVTLNRFSRFEGRDVRGVGIRCVAWTDNNVFHGWNRVSLQANNAVGLVVNESVSTSVYAVPITAAGSGYTSGATIAFSGGGGSGLAGFVIVSGGVVTGVAITNNGTGYTSDPTATISPVGAGSGATASTTRGGPAYEAAVYAMQFDALAIDAFAGLTGRVGVQMNKCKTVVIGDYHHNPEAEGGAIVDNGALSYAIYRTGNPASTTIDAYLKNWRVQGNLPIVGGYIEGTEIADPVAPATNAARLYVRDNGSGKTQIVARFATGVVQVIASEP